MNELHAKISKLSTENEILKKTNQHQTAKLLKTQTQCSTILALLKEQGGGRLRFDQLNEVFIREWKALEKKDS